MSIALQRTRITRVAAALVFSVFTASPTLPVWAADAPATEVKPDTVRQQLIKPLQDAQELLRAGKDAEALTKVHEADSVTDKTPFENYIYQRILGIAALQTGDNEGGVKALEAALATGKTPAADVMKLKEIIIKGYFRAKNYAKAATLAAEYQHDGGTDAQIRSIMENALYLNGDYAALIPELQADIKTVEGSGAVPTEAQLKMLASSYFKQKDDAGYLAVLYKMVQYHPARDYWLDAFSHVQRKNTFNDRLGLDIYRVQFASGNMASMDDYVTMAQMSVQAGYPIEARTVLETGMTAGMNGSGADADRYKRLQDSTRKAAADDEKNLAKLDVNTGVKGPNAMATTGLALVLAGQPDKGIALLQKSLTTPGLKFPEETKLHLAYAFIKAGHKDQAIETLKTVQGQDGSADIATLWLASLYEAPKK